MEFTAKGRKATGDLWYGEDGEDLIWAIKHSSLTVEGASTFKIESGNWIISGVLKYEGDQWAIEQQQLGGVITKLAKGQVLTVLNTHDGITELLD